MKFRGLAIRVLGILTILSLIVILGSMIPHPRRLAQLGPAILTAAYFAYVMMWRPYVEISDGAVVFRNIVQTVHLPWPTITSVSARWSLTITTSGGEFSAWALPATPTGAAPRLARGQTNRSDAQAVGQLIEERYQEFFDAGHLTTPAARHLEPTTTTDKPTVILMTVGLIVSVIAIVLG